MSVRHFCRDRDDFCPRHGDRHDGHLRGGSRALGRVQSGADGAGRDRHEGGGMSEMDTVGKRHGDEINVK